MLLVDRVVQRHLAQRVASRFAKTENLRKLEALIKAMMDPLGELDHWFHSKKTPDQKDQTARLLGEAAKNLLEGSDIIFEDTARGKRLEKTKFMRRFKNFRKLVKAYTKVRTYEDAKAVIDKQATKSKRAHDKLWEYAQEAMGILSHFDSEIAETIGVENYTVTLINTGRDEWNKDGFQRLEHILLQTNKLLNKAGLGKSTGGRVFAYPTKQLTGATGSAGAEASYNVSKNTVRLAVLGNLKNAVHSMVHELGHRVYFKSVSGQGRAAWEQFFGDNVKPPDIDGILKKWDAWAAADEFWSKKYGKWLSYFMSHLREKGDTETLMWLNLIANKWDINEDLHPMTGSPRKKDATPGYDQIIAKKDQIKVFLYPVSAYSGKNAEELFAEVLGYMLVDGPGKVPEIVRDAFGRAVPKMKSAKMLADRVAARHTAAIDERMRKLLESLRKGAWGKITSVKKLKEVLDHLGGWSVEPFVGLVELHHGRDTSYIDLSGGKVDDAYAFAKKYEVKSLPSNPKMDMPYLMGVGKIDTRHDPRFDFKMWVGAAGFKVESPEGKVLELLPDVHVWQRGRMFIDLLTLPTLGKRTGKHIRLYDLPLWIKKETNFEKQLNEALGTEAHVPGPSKPRTRKNTGSCPCCFRNVKLKSKGGDKLAMVNHGFQRPGWGYNVGNCVGVGFPPFEISDEGTKHLLKELLLPRLKAVKEGLQELQSGRVKELLQEGTWGATKTIKEGDPQWERALESAIGKTKNEIFYLNRDINTVKPLLAAWKPQPLPEPGQEAKVWKD